MASVSTRRLQIFAGVLLKYAYDMTQAPMTDAGLRLHSSVGTRGVVSLLMHEALSTQPGDVISVQQPSTSQMLRAVGRITVAYARYLRAFFRRYFSCENSVLLAKVLLAASSAASICTWLAV